MSKRFTAIILTNSNDNPDGDFSAQQREIRFVPNGNHTFMRITVED